MNGGGSQVSCLLVMAATNLIALLCLSSGDGRTIMYMQIFDGATGSLAAEAKVDFGFPDLKATTTENSLTVYDDR